MNISEKWAVLWCPKLGGLHYETIGSMVEKNQLAFSRGEDPGYVVIQVVGNSRDAMEAVREAKAFKRKLWKESHEAKVTETETETERIRVV